MMKSISKNFTRNAVLLACAVTALSCAALTAEARTREVAAWDLNLQNRKVGSIHFFSYSDGKSGYVKIKNTTNRKLVFRVKVILNSNLTRTVRMTLDGYDSSSQSFLHAGTKKDGVKGIRVEYIRRY